MNNFRLSTQRCKPCRGGQRPLPPSQVKDLLKYVAGWKLTSNKKALCQEFRMKDFVTAVDLIRRITPIAQKEDHHPDLYLTGYRNLRIELSTHAIGGLSMNDFILTAKIDQLPKKLKIEILK